MQYFGDEIKCPGDVLKEMVRSGVIRDYNIKSGLGLNDSVYKSLLNGRIRIDEDFAKKLAKITNTKVDYWEQLESEYRKQLMEAEVSRWQHGERPEGYYNNEIPRVRRVPRTTRVRMNNDDEHSSYLKNNSGMEF